jgi:uncharacterized membrane protein
MIYHSIRLGKRLKVGALVTGIILLVIGIALYGILQTSASDCSSFIGQLGRALSPSASQNCQTVSLIQVFGMILAVIGLGVLIYGAVAKNSSSYSSGGKTSQGLKLALIILGMIGLVIVLQMIFPFPFGLISAVTAILILVYYIKKRRKNSPKEPHINTSEYKEAREEKKIRNLDALKERLARGEITKDEYDELKKVFESD